MKLFDRAPKPPHGARMTMKSGMEWEVLPGTRCEREDGSFFIKARPLIRHLRHEQYSALIFYAGDIESVFMSAEL